ncbi:periplasmic binding protein [Nocardioides phosphati]|uniref:Periplasmic binding protein n=1 Tax=Nocardioides phosphati TaxID=1867775 RepID=A0ABQ2N7C3_9ACTN|nr:ABC transporter substrate-binding protein [Nocardioides phosphati]GGO85928.1 periplasmic binding protein [Nocardioides phosphati]
MKLSRTAGLVAALAGVLLSSTACSSAKEDGAAADPAFHAVTIKGALGTAEITERPERVVSLGWSTTDAMLALGVVPVGMEAQPYGGDAHGVLPWVKAKLADMGAKTPEVLTPSSSGDPDYKAILALKPDLVLAPYSGLTQAQYDKLAEIPGVDVVAYPTTPWATPLDQVVDISAEALGVPKARAEAVLDGLDDAVAAKAAEHPEFTGRTIATLAPDTEQFWTYTPADPREKLLRDLGFTTAPSVERFAKTADEGAFAVPFAYEKSTELTSDVLLTYSGSADELKQLQGGAPYKAMAQVKTGAVANLVGADKVAAVGPPTALSLPWALDDLVDLLAKAVKKA